MTNIDPNFVPYWLGESDWLCTTIFLTRDLDDVRSFGAESIGYFFGYAQLTNTRILALLGDPAADAYELLFSFSSSENKERFLELMNSNEFTETEDELLSAPTPDEIRDARPLGMVLDEDIMRQATAIAMALMVQDESQIVN